MKVIVHGGAGSDPDDPAPRQATLNAAANAGAAEADVVDAVESAVRVLEDDVRFNAGTGGAVQSDGVIRTDAGLMTSGREAGAVASMPGVEAAVSVARAVMEETPHVLLNGVHAVDFAADIGVDVECDLWSEDTRERWDALDDHPEGTPLDHLEWIRDKFGTTDPGGREEDVSGDDKDHDTVGAVAYNGEKFASATSTGTLARARGPGRRRPADRLRVLRRAGGRRVRHRRRRGHREDHTHAARGPAPRERAGRPGGRRARHRGVRRDYRLVGRRHRIRQRGERGEAFNSSAMQTSVARE